MEDTRPAEVWPLLPAASGSFRSEVDKEEVGEEDALQDSGTDCVCDRVVLARPKLSSTQEP